MRARLIGVVLVLIHAAPAAAQPGAAPVAAAPPVAPAAGAAGVALEPGIRDDAASGRTWLSPTALTPPAGTFGLQSVQILIAGASYSPTDSIAVAVNAFYPIPGLPWIGFGNVKIKLAEVGPLKVAAHAAVGYVRAEVRDDDGDAEDEAGEGRDESAVAAFVGGVGTVCLDRGCHSVLNGYIAATLAADDDATLGPLPVMSSLAWIHRLGGRAKLALEVFTVSDDQFAEAGVLLYGLRFTWPSFALDAGLVRLFCDDCEDDDDDRPALGLPWLAFTYRAL